MAVLDDIREQFPQLAWLINDPEVGNLLSQAVDPNTTFSAQRFQAELQNTNWWRSRSQPVREWEILSNIDPGTAQSQRTSFIQQLFFMAEQMGVGLTYDQARWITEEALQAGYDVNHPHVRQGLAKIVTHGMSPATFGVIPTYTQQIKALAKSDYFIPIRDADAQWYASRIASGAQTLEDVQAELQKKSISAFPHLQEELGTGKTMGEIFSGHINVISNELELSPTEIDLTNGQWFKVISTFDTTNGATRPLSLSETRTLARQDNRFWNTSNGRAMDSQMANNLLRQFGARR